MPKRLQDKILYPAISLASRENHKVEINLGLKRFEFDVDKFLIDHYYFRMFDEIHDQKKTQLSQLSY